jgi:CheY-like chemotaxis protein
VARVLIVDDESDIRQAVAEVLAEEGHQVVAAGDGEEALAQIRAFHPELVLLDLMMPVMDGHAFAQVLYGRERDRAIPIVVISADGDPQKAAALGARGFLAKPFDIDALLSEVESLAHPQ